MTVSQWFNSAQDYTYGVEVYASLPQCNKVLLRYFNRAATPAHINKLKYELGKFYKSPAKKKVVKEQPVVAQVRFRESENTTYYLENLPAAVHPQRVRAQQIYIELRQLKLELNALHLNMEEAAMALQMNIWYKRKENISLWQQIEYYLKNKKHLPKPINDLDTMTGARLLQCKANMMSQIANHKTTIAKNEKLLSTAITVAEKAKYQKAIDRSTDKLLSKKATLTEIENKIYING